MQRPTPNTKNNPVPLGGQKNLLPVVGDIPITDVEFGQFQRLIFQIAGISLSSAKKVLLVVRLSKRLKQLGLHSFGQYYRHITETDNSAEQQMMVDLLTTNETYFFREPKHFDFLREVATKSRNKDRTFRVWSAAASSGEEAYSIAMVLAEALEENNWEVVGTDISSRVLAKAQLGHYPMERAQHIPVHLLKKYCLKGVQDQAGTLLVEKTLRERVQFMASNLMQPNKGLGQFDVIFLRNVMIYFNNETKQKVINNLMPFLKSTGYIIIGHSESLNGLDTELVSIQPTIYCRAGMKR